MQRQQGKFTRHFRSFFILSLASITAVEAFTAISLWPGELPVDSGISKSPEWRSRYSTVASAYAFDNVHFNLTSNAAWSALIPTNGGVVHSSLHEPARRVAVYQHLDCLNTVRRTMANLWHLDYTAPYEHQIDFERVEGCFGLLRQLYLCAADSTLEDSKPISQPDGSYRAGNVTGIGIYHRCTDWHKLLEDVDGIARPIIHIRSKIAGLSGSTSNPRV